ncbi:MAG TPA: triose-phosphate isomerase [Syntrophales bacterium]|nr:triose-phosphate isomerase [Syntrophales bacterium]
MRRPIIAGNWKMHKTVRESVDFARQLMIEYVGSPDRSVIVAPPFTSLYAVAQVLFGSGIHLAAQNLHDKQAGAFTGEISAAMLADCGCGYVIVGHSERRTIFGERDDFINRKLKTAISFDLRPIFCIGETLEEREGGLTFSVIERQIKEGLNKFTADDIKNCVIAYEPVWAIGTGRTATPEQAQEVHAYIRSIVAAAYGDKLAALLHVIYGGSVNPGNIGGLMAQPDIDGALVGGASLDVENFVKIIRF